jgi:hypothetical protein
MITIGMIGADGSYAGEPPDETRNAGLVELPALVPPYFSARAAKFRMFVERLFHKSGSAALLERSPLDPRAISWAWMNFRNERRTPSHGVVEAHIGASTASNTHRARTRSAIKPTSIRGDRTRSGILPSARNRLARPLVRRYAGRSKRGRLTRPVASGGWKRSHGHHGAGKPLASPGFPDEGWQVALWLRLEKRLKSETHELQVLRGNHVEGQVHRG